MPQKGSAVRQGMEGVVVVDVDVRFGCECLKSGRRGSKGEDGLKYRRAR